MTGYDEIVEADAETECNAWIRKLIDAKDDIVAFVDARLNGGGTGTYKGFLKGSFNLSYHIDFGDRRPSVIIRFAMPGESVTPWREEKVLNEVQFIEHLRENTTIPVPHILCWGSLDDSPRQLGPFIIMELGLGTRLSAFLKRPTDDEYETAVLNPDLDETTLDSIYEQIAEYMLQMSQLTFSRIGAISKDNRSGSWIVTGRPLTFDMNILVTSVGYPVDRFCNSPINCTSDFFESISHQHLLHLETQRNLATDKADAQRRFVARQRFKQLISKYCTDDTGPFRPFCDDFHPGNMLIDPVTFRITLVFDFEFTNSMPSQFSFDPPWWLLLKGPGIWIEENGVRGFLANYLPKMEQFLRALKRVEARSVLSKEEPHLSERMRDSWDTKRFWFNYAARRCLDIDNIYWEALHDDGDGDGLSLLDPLTQAALGPLVRIKMEQLEAYRAEYASRFPE